MSNSNESQPPQAPQNLPPQQPSNGEGEQDQQTRLRIQAEQAMYREFMENQPKLIELAKLGIGTDGTPADPVVGQLIEEICKRMCMLAERVRDENGATISEYWGHHVFQTLVAPMWAYGYQAGRWQDYLQNEAPKALSDRYDAAKNPILSGQT